MLYGRSGKREDRIGGAAKCPGPENAGEDGEKYEPEQELDDCPERND